MSAGLVRLPRGLSFPGAAFCITGTAARLAYKPNPNGKPVAKSRKDSETAAKPQSWKSANSGKQTPIKNLLSASLPDSLSSQVNSASFREPGAPGFLYYVSDTRSAAQHLAFRSSQVGSSPCRKCRVLPEWGAECSEGINWATE